MSQETQKEIKLNTFLLYSDLNTRLNIIYEECMHLQNLLASLMGPEWGFDMCFSSEAKSDYKERDKRRDQTYYNEPTYNKLNSYEKSFQSMIDILGAVALAVEENKKHLNKAYLAVKQGGAGNFWFINLRGFYLNYNVNRYTEAIQTVHEKLVQILETWPASIPQPILLRRWNSSSQEQFLARYSRHAKWEIYHVIKSLPNNPDDESSQLEINDEGWKKDSVLHAWVHRGTSTTIQYKHKFKDNKKDYSTISIQSSYFYLEQPQLFPLIYHEIAHHFIDEEMAKFNKVGHDAKKQGSVFIQRLEEVSNLLNKAIYRKDLDDWLNINGEVWTDAIAIATCGKAYLSALSLQIFGLNGEGFFSLNKNNIPNQDELELSELGANQTKLFSVPEIEGQSIHELTWEARLRFSCWLLKELSDNGHWGNSEDYKESIATLTKQINHDIDVWYVEGRQFIYAPHLTSSEHASQWEYRKRLNDFVLKMWQESFEDCIRGLKRIKPISGQFVLEDEIKSVIAKATLAQHEKYSETSNLERRIINKIFRLEDCALEARNMIGDLIKDKQEIKNLLDYTQTDGSTVFRLVQEWHDFRRSIFSTLSEIVDSIEKNDKQETTQIKQLLKLASNSEVSETAIVEVIKEQGSLKKFSEYLKTGRFFENLDQVNNESYKHATLKVLDIIEYNQLMNNICSILLRYNQLDIRVFSLGQFRIGNEDAKNKLLENLYKRKQEYHTKASELFNAAQKPNSVSSASTTDTNIQNNASKKVTNKNLSQVKQIIGDYDFYYIDKGVTPLECDVHLTNMPKIITKPRSVICVLDSVNKDDIKNKLGKLSLLKFRHRWELLSLFNKLSLDGNTVPCQFFISSGWEDAVLITWHNDFKAMLYDVEKIGLTEDVEYGSCDSQTSLIPPAEESESPNNDGLKLRLHVIRKYKLEEKDKERWKKPNAGLTSFKKIELFGRNDNIFEFKSNNPKVYFDTLKKLPKHFWAGCQNFHTEISWEKPKEDKGKSQ